MATASTTAIEVWDKRWATAEGRADWLDPESEIIALLLELKARRTRTALDVGCGVGRHALVLAEHGLAVLGLSVLFEGGAWLIAFREFRKNRGQSTLFRAVHRSKDPTIFTVLFEDTAALLGLVTALLGIALGQALDLPVLDGVASLVIGLILAVTAAFLAYESQSLLTGEGVDPEVRASIRAIAATEPGVVRLKRAADHALRPSGRACRSQFGLRGHDSRRMG